MSAANSVIFSKLDKLNLSALSVVVYTKKVDVDPNTDLLVQSFVKKADQNHRHLDRFDFLYYGDVTELADTYEINKPNVWFTNDVCPARQYMAWLNRRLLNHCKVLQPCFRGEEKNVFYMREMSCSEIHLYVLPDERLLEQNPSLHSHISASLTVTEL